MKYAIAILLALSVSACGKDDRHPWEIQDDADQASCEDRGGTFWNFQGGQCDLTGSMCLECLNDGEMLLDGVEPSDDQCTQDMLRAMCK